MIPNATRRCRASRPNACCRWSKRHWLQPALPWAVGRGRSYRGHGRPYGLRIGLAGGRGKWPSHWKFALSASRLRGPRGGARRRAAFVAIEPGARFFCQCFGPGGAEVGEPEILGARRNSLAAQGALPLITASLRLRAEKPARRRKNPGCPRGRPPRAAAFASLVAGRSIIALGGGRPGGFTCRAPLYLRQPEARLPRSPPPPGQARCHIRRPPAGKVLGGALRIRPPVTYRSFVMGRKNEKISESRAEKCNLLLNFLKNYCIPVQYNERISYS